MTSLQNLCINTIVKEFVGLFFAYKKSNDGTLKRNFEFLQRKYSYQLVSEMWSKAKSKNEHLGFLLNDYLKVLSTVWVLQHPLRDILCHLPNLIGIEFFIHDGNDENLKNVAKFCPKIVQIDGSMAATDDGLKYLCKNENGKFPCPELKILRHFTGITDAGMKYLLLNLPSLEYIDFGNVPECLYSLHKTSVPEQDKKFNYNLVHLDFLKLDATSSQYIDILRTCLALCPKLKSIACYITHEEQLNLLKNINLKSLDICFSNNDPKIDISNFLKCDGYNLTSLCIENCTMSINDLAASCPKLKSLQIASVTLLHNAHSQPSFHSLVDCTFSYNDPKFDISNFLKCHGYNLTSLYAENCTMSINDLAASYPKLKSLHIKSVTFLHNEHSQPIFHSLVDCSFSFIADDTNTNKAIHNLLLFSPKLEEISFLNCDLSVDTKIYVLKCCEKYPLKKILFQDTVVELNFLKDILLNCPSLRSLAMKEWSPTTPFPKIPYDEDVKELFDLAGKLPNKPKFQLDGIDYDDIDDYDEYDYYEEDYNDDSDNYFGDGNDNDNDDDDDKMDYDDDQDKMNYDDDEHKMNYDNDKR